MDPPSNPLPTRETNLVGSMLLLALLYKARRGPNAPMGLWVASWAGTPFGGAAFEAAEILRQVDEEASVGA